jgi:hypothetical protein
MASVFLFQFEVTVPNLFWIKLLTRRLELRVIIYFLFVASDHDIEPALDYNCCWPSFIWLIVFSVSCRGRTSVSDSLSRRGIFPLPTGSPRRRLCLQSSSLLSSLTSDRRRRLVVVPKPVTPLHPS